MNQLKTTFIFGLIQILCLPLLGQDPQLYNRKMDSHQFEVFMEDGGWCWFQDPRAIIHQEQLLVGGVQGNENGSAWVGRYDLKRRKIKKKTMLIDQFDRDDHNSPVFYVRPDKTVLSVYARHHVDSLHLYRISTGKNAKKWGPEKSFLHDYPGAGKVTYMNLYYLSEDKKLYNFFRGINYNPSYVNSLDHGLSWSDPTHFISSELEGRHRPYARYQGDGKATIHVSFTDGHPRKFGNSIYYAAFRNGQFWRADGSLIKDLHKEGPLRPSEAEVVYQGSGAPGRADYQSAPGSAWTSAMAYDSNGYPHIAYTLYLSNTDHRYRIASWNGEKWIDREVAFAGKCLYDRESSYTGLISLDPMDPSYVVISTDVDPNTGKDLAGKHEIYQAQISATDHVETIHWKAITQNSPVRNLRPTIVRGDGYRVIAWLRGIFESYTNYQLDVVGIVD